MRNRHISHITFKSDAHCYYTRTLNQYVSLQQFFALCFLKLDCCNRWM